MAKLHAQKYFRRPMPTTPPKVEDDGKVYNRKLKHSHNDRWWENLQPEDFTCFDCPDKGTCPFVNDPYNTNGDCLASK